MNRFSYLTGFIILAVLLCPAKAQVRPLPGGRALDSNYLIGSGGYNTIRYTRRPFNANLYVTGQVTGGFYFHGELPYSAANELSTQTASAGMERFERGSVGLQQVITGVHYGPSMYLPPSSTVLSAAGIARGYNAPGSSMPRASYIPPKVAEKLFNKTIKAYSPINLELGRQLQVNPLIPPQQVAAPIGSASSSGLSAVSRGALRPRASSLFGVPGTVKHEEIAKELTQGQGERIGQNVARRENTEIKPQQAGESQALPTETPREGQPPGAVVPSAAKLPSPGEDVLFDLLMLMEKIIEQDQQQEVPNALGTEENAPTVPEATRGKHVPPPTLPGDDEQEDNKLIRPLNIGKEKTGRRGAVEAIKGRIVLHTLAGKSRDVFNVNMSRAEKALSAGKYYEAAEYYKVAAVASPSSMLAPLGRSLALFAADEPVSASFHLRRAMERFAPLLTGEVVPDVKKIISPKVVELRLSQLERRISQAKDNPDMELLFLVSFIRCSIGQMNKAAEHAETLLKILGPEKKDSQIKNPYIKRKRRVFRIYARHVLQLARSGKEKPIRVPAEGK